uniref:Uncharacterized protein n=1 Tax=Knipowitschia caucasica TaxID=637954 RepID=A0AAV2J603_KNICA
MSEEQVSDCVEGVQRLFSNSLMMREKSNKGKMPARKCDMCRVIQGAVLGPLKRSKVFSHLNKLKAEVTVHTLAEAFHLPQQEAIEKFIKGPKYEPCEFKMIANDLVRHLPEEAAGRLKAFQERWRLALSSEAFLSRL